MTGEPAAERPPWGALVTLSAGVSLIIIDATIVNVALPTIIDQLDLTLTQAEWVNSTYALVFASLLILFGRLGDALGRRRVFIGGHRRLRRRQPARGGRPERRPPDPRPRRPGRRRCGRAADLALARQRHVPRRARAGRLRRLGRDDRRHGRARAARRRSADRVRRLALDLPRQPAARASPSSCSPAGSCRSRATRRPCAAGTCRGSITLSLGLGLLRLRR